MRRTALGAACIASAPLLAHTGLVDSNGRPLSSSPNDNLPFVSSLDVDMSPADSPAEVSYTVLRESIIAGLGLVPAVGGLLSLVAAQYLPEPGKSTEQMWREIVDARISDALFRKVQRDLIGLTDATRLYKNAIAAKDPKEIRETSIAVNVAFTTHVPGFQISGEEVSLLPLFAIAASMHLSLLRDIAIKGKDIGLNDASIANYRTELTKNIQTYTQYVDRHVAAGVEKAKSDNPNKGTPATRNQPLHAMLLAKASYQLYVLDFRETWPSFDAVNFPTATKVELKRELLSPIGGWWDSKSKAPDELPNWKAPTARVKNLTIWAREQWRSSFLMGVSVLYSDGSRLETGKKLGNPLSFDTPWDIDDVQGRYSSGLYNCELRDTATTKGVGVGRQTGEVNDQRFHYRYPGHRLSSMRSVGEGRDASEEAMSGCIFGFQLVDQGPRPLSPQAFDLIAPNVAPPLLDWIAS